MQTKAFKEKILRGCNRKDKQNTVYQTKLSPKRQKAGLFKITVMPV